LSSFAGKYVLLQFTAAWCGPSNFEVPQDRDEIAALNDSAAMCVEVVYLTVMLDGPSVNVASTQANAVNWANHFGLTTPVLWTANDTNLSARQEFNSYLFQSGQPQPAVPTLIFIRPNGQIFGVRMDDAAVPGRPAVTSGPPGCLFDAAIPTGVAASLFRTTCAAGNTISGGGPVSPRHGRARPGGTMVEKRRPAPLTR
jgi:hypothetical protein